MKVKWEFDNEGNERLIINLNKDDIKTLKDKMDLMLLGETVEYDNIYITTTTDKDSVTWQQRQYDNSKGNLGGKIEIHLNKSSLDNDKIKLKKEDIPIIINLNHK